MHKKCTKSSSILLIVMSIKTEFCFLAQEPESPTRTPPPSPPHLPQDLGFFETFYPVDQKNKMFPEKNWDALCIFANQHFTDQN